MSNACGFHTVPGNYQYNRCNWFYIFPQNMFFEMRKNIWPLPILNICTAKRNWIFWNEACVCELGSCLIRGVGAGALICAVCLWGRRDGGNSVVWSGLVRAMRPSVPSAPGTKEGNLFCHNLARGLSTLHLFVRRWLGGELTHALQWHTRTHTRQREIPNAYRKCGWNWPFAEASEVGVMRGRKQGALLLSCSGKT